MKHVFGPVPSRRLGKSLGIDPIPEKTCDWNCVYCQLGRTKPVTMERREYFPREDIIAELEAVLRASRPGDIDWITFVGSGEPTLHSGLGWMIRRAKELGRIPVAVITNGSLLYLEEVRRDLAAADAVLPSLDAATPALYRKLNRPHPEATLERLIEGLATFRKEYTGRLWVEVMLLSGLNDTEAELKALAVALEKIKPDEIHLSLPTRPPAESWVRPADEAGQLRAAAILGKTARVLRPAEAPLDLAGFADPARAIVEITSRHPLSEREIVRGLAKWTEADVRETLRALRDEGRVQVVERYGERFWTSAGAWYPEGRPKDKNKD
jgi:wyosine [tRNA(Phe)-imidazoG37] synthetase (radical SAM superfamily)